MPLLVVIVLEEMHICLAGVDDILYQKYVIITGIQTIGYWMYIRLLSIDHICGMNIRSHGYATELQYLFQ